MKEQGHRRTARLLAPGFWSRKTSQSERVEDPNPDCCSSSDMSTSRVYRNRCVDSFGLRHYTGPDFSDRCGANGRQPGQSGVSV